LRSSEKEYNVATHVPNYEHEGVCMGDFALSQMKSVGACVTDPRSCPQLLHHRSFGLRHIVVAI
jgi:hypothetical protein